jgi:hypothetical protein
VKAHLDGSLSAQYPDWNYIFVNPDKASTKGGTFVHKKLKAMEETMIDYLGIDEKVRLRFVKENVNPEVTVEDIEQYESMVEDLSLNVNNESKLLEAENRNALIGVVAYSFLKEIDLDDWFVDYFDRTNSYFPDTKERYKLMIDDLHRFVEER